MQEIKVRVGEAGATELKINPWAASSGLAGSNTSSVIGIEAMSLNVAGLAFLNKTEIGMTSTNWLSGSDISINSLGLGQRLGESSVLGIGITAMSFGKIDVTTVNQPELGQNGTFTPLFLNIALSYAKAFSNSIYGGITVRSVSQQIANASARGISLDAGIRYVTGGPANPIKFGISLRNVGPKLEYSGDGFSEGVVFNDVEYTLEQRAQGFEMPALLSIGASYDFNFGYIDSTKKSKPVHVLTTSGNFLSNSFGKDQLMIGVEYGYSGIFKVRGGYAYENGLTGASTSKDFTNAFTGPTAGASVYLPLNKITGSNISFDYSYRATVSFSGTHSFGLKITL
jgi:hypothetical protein